MGVAVDRILTLVYLALQLQQVEKEYQREIASIQRAHQPYRVDGKRIYPFFLEIKIPVSPDTYPIRIPLYLVLVLSGISSACLLESCIGLWLIVLMTTLNSVGKILPFSVCLHKPLHLVIPTVDAMLQLAHDHNTHILCHQDLIVFVYYLDTLSCFC